MFSETNMGVLEYAYASGGAAQQKASPSFCPSQCSMCSLPVKMSAAHRLPTALFSMYGSMFEVQFQMASLSGSGSESGPPAEMKLG